MIGSITRWIGGGLLTGALALASSGAATPQQKTPLPSSGAQEGACTAADEAALADLDAADFDLDESALAIDAMSLAVDEAQDSQDGATVRVFSNSNGPGWLGIRMEEITSAKAKELNLPAERGVLVTYVAEDSPAAKAGLKVGDVITDFDGQRLEGTLTLQRLVRETPTGRKVSLSIWRDGRAQSLTAELGSRHSSHSGDHDYFYVNPPDFNFELPSIPAIAPMPRIELGPFNTFRMFGGPSLGIDAEDLSGQLGKYFGAPDGEGILVREVMPGLPAEKAGLKAGDVILRVDGKRVKETSELRSALREKVSKAAEGAESGKAPTPTVELTILRSGKESVVRVELEVPKPRVRPAAHRVAV